MAHSRERLALLALKKKLKFFRIVSIQGARQTGKSYLAKTLLPEYFPTSKSFSLDSKIIRDQAENNPDSFLESHKEYRPLVIDEAQKAPNIFDAVKLVVDKENQPGRFILLGSTEFSRELKIRESLTGRLGRIRIFPMNYHEAIGLSAPFKCNRSQFLKHLEHGGLPGIVFVRDEENRSRLIEDWIEIICSRDIHQFKGWRLDTDIAKDIIGLCATLDEPTCAAIARKLRQTGRKIQKHLDALMQLFALQKVNPHPDGRGKSIYYPIDSAIVKFLGGDLHRQLVVTLMNEVLCEWHYVKLKTPKLYYYRSASKNRIDLVVGENSDDVTAYQIFSNESVPETQMNILRALQEKVKKLKVNCYYPGPTSIMIDKFKILPWEEMFIPYKVKT